MKLRSILAILLSACGGELEESVTSDAIAAPTSSTRSVELCFRFGHGFTANGGDYPAGTLIKGLGVRFKITGEDGVESFYNADVATGCKRLELEKYDSYTVTILAEATFADGNRVRVMSNETSKGLYGWTASSNLEPYLLLNASGKRYPIVIFDWMTDDGPVDHISSVMFALIKGFAGHALTRGEDYRVYLSQGPCPDNTLCFNASRDPAGPAVWLNGFNNPTNLQDKFAILHEVAHLGLYLDLGGAIGSEPLDYGLESEAGVTSACADGALHSVGDGNLPLGSEEYANAAFNEAFPQYVAASVWNDPAGADCTYRNLDCYEPGSAYETCYAGEDFEKPEDTSFERDWLTAFFALERADGCGIPFQILADIVKDASPLLWNEGDASFMLQWTAYYHLDEADFECFQDTLEARIH